MSIDKKVIDRLESLLNTGRNIVADDPVSAHPAMKPIPKDEASSRWATSCQSILTQVFGESSVHYQRFSKLTCKRFTLEEMQRAVGVLAAAKDDYENGYLLNVRKAITAEVFDEFLDQAQHLFDLTYYQPAAVIAGAVLEDGLRKLCDANGISLPDKPKLDWMNAELAKRGVYNVLKQKQVTVYADLRNKAAHGKWKDFKDTDVAEMLVGVRNFMQDQF